MRRHLPLIAGFLAFVVATGSGCSPKAAPVEPTEPSATVATPVTVPLQATVQPTPQATVTLPVLPSPAAIAPEATVGVIALELATEVPTPEPEVPIEYTVQTGDTLLGIAMAFDVPMAAVQLANDLGTATLINLGQILEIPVAQAWAEASPFWVVYEVEAGETLGEIAAFNGISLDDLLAANSGLDADRIAVGQALVLPLHSPQELLAKATAPEPQPVVPTATPEPVVAVQSEPLGTEPTAPPGVEPPQAPPSEPTAVPLPPAAPADAAALPAEIFRLVNEQRAAYGLPPLAWNDTLARAAQRHADDCYSRGWCSHTGSDGSTYKERIIREGYDPARWSECWAWYGSAERAVAMWMDEVPPNDPHRRTILNDALTEVGVGVVPGNGFGYYFIADFGAPR